MQNKTMTKRKLKRATMSCQIFVTLSDFKTTASSRPSFNTLLVHATTVACYLENLGKVKVSEKQKCLFGLNTAEQRTEFLSFL